MYQPLCSTECSHSENQNHYDEFSLQETLCLSLSGRADLKTLLFSIIKQLSKYYHYKSCPDFSLGISYKSVRFAVLALQAGYTCPKQCNNGEGCIWKSTPHSSFLPIITFQICSWAASSKLDTMTVWPGDCIYLLMDCVIIPKIIRIGLEKCLFCWLFSAILFTIILSELIESK